jgi:hypothetical protein
MKFICTLLARKSLLSSFGFANKSAFKLKTQFEKTGFFFALDSSAKFHLK